MKQFTPRRAAEAAEAEAAEEAEEEELLLGCLKMEVVRSCPPRTTVPSDAASR